MFSLFHWIFLHTRYLVEFCTYSIEFFSVKDYIMIFSFSEVLDCGFNHILFMKILMKMSKRVSHKQRAQVLYALHLFFKGFVMLWKTCHLHWTGSCHLCSLICCIPGVSTRQITLVPTSAILHSEESEIEG